MKDWNHLTAKGRLRRLRGVALSALKSYDLDPVELKLVGSFTNTIFRLRSGDGRLYQVRVARPRWRTLADLRSAAIWLMSLARDTDIGAPVPVPNREGLYVLRAESESVPEPRFVVVETWISGRKLRGCLTEANLAKMGSLMARLHLYCETYQPGPGFTDRRMDRILSRGEEDVLFSQECLESLPSLDREVLITVKERVNRFLGDLYADSAGLRVIHNDLNHDNIMVEEGRLRPFDFEDTVLGYPVQDIAMAFQDLATEVSLERFQTLTEAFRSGYEAVYPWPEREAGDVDALRVGRIIWIANYVATFEREHLINFVKRIKPLFTAFLESGSLAR